MLPMFTKTSFIPGLLKMNKTLLHSLIIASIACPMTIALAAEAPSPSIPEASIPEALVTETKPESSPMDLAPGNNTPEYVILQPSDEATFSSETAASVSKLNVKEGSYFRAGDILLLLDCRVQKAEYEKSVAQQAAMQIAVKSAEKLKKYDSISEFELVKAKAEAAMANADVDKLAAILDKCVVKAPFNGAVAELKVHTYETVKPGDPLLKIVNTEHIIVQLQVPSEWLQWLHIDSTFNVHINEINKSITAKIIRINPEIEPVSQTVRIVGEIQPTSEKLLPGMSGQAIFTENPSKARGVPNADAG